MGELLWRDLEAAIELTADVLAGRITEDQPTNDGEDPASRESDESAFGGPSEERRHAIQVTPARPKSLASE